jgi:flagellar P-ring protein precursor FlgI
MRDTLILLLCLPLIMLAGFSLWAGEVAPPKPAPAAPAAPVVLEQRIRIKDIAEVQGVRENQLIGNGVVIGLDGSGDQSSGIANIEIANIQARWGLTVTASDVKSKNIAAVIVTAKLSAFAKKGSRIDVQVSSIGDAKSLVGGVLVQCPLVGADGRVYAVAQGALSVGGFSGGGGGSGGSSVSKNHPVVGRIPEAALVEREVPTDFATSNVVRLRLRQPDFTTARRMAEAINAKWKDSSRATDWSGIEVRFPEGVGDDGQRVTFISEMENLTLVPDVAAKVVFNERTGTIVAGANVRLAPTAISQGNLFITIKNTAVISQPEPLSKGKTVVESDQSTSVTEEQARLVILDPGPTLGELARALNALKVTPRDMIAIFQALKDAGALHAELIIM